MKLSRIRCSCAICASTLGAMLFLMVALIVTFAMSRPTRLDPEGKPKSHSGLQLAWAGNGTIRSNGTDIIFVHGLGSNPDTTWQARKQHKTGTTPQESDVEPTNWILDFLPEDLPESVRDNARVFFYNYDSYWKRDALASRLSIYAEQLIDSVDRSCESEKERSRGVVFVTHSYGGILLKQALIQAHADSYLSYILERTRSIIFLGAPHRGSSFGFWGTWLARVLKPLNGASPELLKNLDYDSGFLRDMHRDFYRISMEDWQIHNLWEQRPQPRIQLGNFRLSAFVVKEQSATFEGRNVHNFPLPVDHRGLNKFDEKSEAYEVILARLAKACMHATKPTKHHFIVSMKKTPAYVTRTELMADIEVALAVHHNDATVPHAVSLYGLGGRGKSQAALNFAESHCHRYNPILWINADDEQMARTSFHSFAHELKLSIDAAPHQGGVLDDPTVQAVLRWFRERGEDDDEWLVVLDNADDLTWNLDRLIPQGARGSVIITSQDKHSKMLIPGACEEIEIGDMSPDESAQILLRRLQVKHDTTSYSVTEQCYSLAEELGYFALAIDLAGASISNDPDIEPDKALARYIKDYRKHRDDLLKSDRFKGLMPTQQTVWTVWDASLQRITSGADAQFQPDFLLAFLSVFKADTIYEEMFRLASLGMTKVQVEPDVHGATLAPGLNYFLTASEADWDDFQYRQARNALVRFGLLQTLTGQPDGFWPGVTIHKLVRWRVSQNGVTHLRWSHIVFVVAACVQLEEEGSPEFRRFLVAQLIDILEDALTVSNITTRDGGPVLPVLAKILYDEGRWEEAERLEMRVIDMSRSSVDKGRRLTSMANLALIYRQQGRWKEAEELQVQVVEMSKTELGASDLDTIKRMGGLASIYRKQGRWQEAEVLQKKVVETSKARLGADHPDTLTSITNIASIYRKLGRWQEAEQLQLQVVATSKTKLGPDHPDTLNRMGNLAMSYMDLGRLEEAEKLQEQLLKTSIAKLGSDHPSTIKRTANMASIYRQQGRWQEAKELQVQVVEISRTRWGVDHPDTLQRLGNLAATFTDWGRFAEAEEIQVWVTETSKMRLGIDHPDTMTSMNNLAHILKSLGKTTEAIQLMEECISLRQVHLGPDDPYTMFSSSVLAQWVSETQEGLVLD